MEDMFSDPIDEMKKQNKSRKTALYRRTSSLREVRRRMKAAKSAEKSSLLSQKLQHAM